MEQVKLDLTGLFGVRLPGVWRRKLGHRVSFLRKNVRFSCVLCKLCTLIFEPFFFWLCLLVGICYFHLILLSFICFGPCFLFYSTQRFS